VSVRISVIEYVVITTPFGTVTEGIFDLQVSGTPAEPYALQAAPDLRGWTDLVVGTLPGYTITLSDTNAGANPVRFYRISSTAPP